MTKEKETISRLDTTQRVDWKIIAWKTYKKKEKKIGKKIQEKSKKKERKPTQSLLCRVQAVHALKWANN